MTEQQTPAWTFTTADSRAAHDIATPLVELLAKHPRSTRLDDDDDVMDYCKPCSGNGVYALWPCPALVGPGGLTIRDYGIYQIALALGRSEEYDAGTRARGLAQIIEDLSRCPHGRHEGDSCAGWRGPGPYDGGCKGGRSLGNPVLPPGKIIGTGLSAMILYRVPVSRDDRHTRAGWNIPTPPGDLLHHHATAEKERDNLAQALRAANQALVELGARPFAPGIGQIDPAPPREPFQLDEGETVTGGYGSPPPREQQP